MENITPVSPLPSKKIIRISKKKLVIWVIILLVIGFLAYGALYIRQKTFGTNNSASIQMPCIESPGVKCPSSNNKRYDSNYYPNTNSEDITDTREFNKVSYKGDIKTRKVKDVMDGVQDAIEIADGRIDNLNVSTNYGHAIFVIPKSNLADFKEDIEKLTHKKLYTETTTSQNLLGQKQNIEEQTENTNESLASLKLQQQNLTASHNKFIANLEAQLPGILKDLSDTRIKQASTTDEAELAQLAKDEAKNLQRETITRGAIKTENTNYNNNYQNLQNQINSYNTTLTGLEKQDEKFENNIETVNGYITVGFISYWDMLKIFSPIHPTFLIIILVIIIWLCIRKKSYVPKVQFV